MYQIFIFKQATYLSNWPQVVSKQTALCRCLNSLAPPSRRLRKHVVMRRDLDLHLFLPARGRCALSLHWPVFCCFDPAFCAYFTFHSSNVHNAM